MNHVKKLNQYFKELARTYHLFFKSAPLIATFGFIISCNGTAKNFLLPYSAAVV